MNTSNEARRAADQMVVSLSDTMREQMDLTGRAVEDLTQISGQFVRTFLAQLPRTSSGCEIPSPAGCPWT